MVRSPSVFIIVEILQTNGKWTRRNWKTTPHRASVTTFSTGDEDEDGSRGEEVPLQHIGQDEHTLGKEEMKNGGVVSSTYKEEIREMIEANNKKLEDVSKIEKMTRWMNFT